MVSVRRIIDFAFALSLSVGVGVMAIIFPFVDGAKLWNIPVVAGFLVSILVAYVLGTRRPSIHSNTVWKHSAIAFIVFIALNTVFGTGVTTSNGSPLLVLGIWFVSAMLSYSYYRYREQTRTS